MQKFHETISSLYLKLSRRKKRWFFRVIDLVIFFLSITLAFSLRFEGVDVWPKLAQYRDLILLLIPLKMLFFWVMGSYRPVLRYIGLEFVGTMIKAVVGSTGTLALCASLFRIAPFPRSVLIMDAALTFLFALGIRVIVRSVIHYSSSYNRNGGLYPERVLIYGAGVAGVQLLQALSREDQYQVVGFIDDNRQMQNQAVNGITVYPYKKIPKLIKKKKVESVLLAMPSAGRQQRRTIVTRIQEHDLPIKVVPGIRDILSGKVSISDIRNIDITDLLGREEVQPVPALLQKNIRDKVILVTGAGGSIGSELCRQIAQQKPKKLILFERNEFALYNVEIDIQESYPELETVTCLGTVTDQARMEGLFSEYAVETVYHAAAYKHVPLVEANVSDGVWNNVHGTYSCVKAAVAAKVDTFVLISTDKAVRPTNVMGATKRIAELILQAFSQREEGNTRFVMVRFGNVLDSAGSVVPRFRKQIAQGENLSLTHQDITRYFMSIPEAAKLVIQAGAMGKGGDVFLLDMGEPVRIYDLAVQMIELSGLSVGQDIDIEITGLRPGEKLYEELLIEHDNSLETSHPKIYAAREKFFQWEELKFLLEKLLRSTQARDEERIILELKQLVPEYNPKRGAAPIDKSNSPLSLGKVIPLSSSK